MTPTNKKSQDKRINQINYMKKWMSLKMKINIIKMTYKKIMKNK